MGCKPIAHPDALTADMLGSADLVEEVSIGGSKIIKVLGAVTKAKTVSILVRGSNKLVLEEADRSIHDALCVLRCLVKKRCVYVCVVSVLIIIIIIYVSALQHSELDLHHYCYCYAR